MNKQTNTEERHHDRAGRRRRARLHAAPGAGPGEAGARKAQGPQAGAALGRGRPAGGQAPARQRAGGRARRRGRGRRVKGKNKWRRSRDLAKQHEIISFVCNRSMRYIAQGHQVGVRVKDKCTRASPQAGRQLARSRGRAPSRDRARRASPSVTSTSRGTQRATLFAGLTIRRSAVLRSNHNSGIAFSDQAPLESLTSAIGRTDRRPWSPPLVAALQENSSSRAAAADDEHL